MPGDVTPACGDGLPAGLTDAIALLSAGQAWPETSETAAWELSRVLRQLHGGLDQAAADHAAAGDLVLGGWNGAAALAFEEMVRQLARNPGSGLLALAQSAAAYADQADNLARETQYTKLSINSAYWVTVSAIAAALIAASFSLGTAALAVAPLAVAGRTVILQLMERLAAAVARDYGARAAGSLTRPAGMAVLHEIVEEGLEEGFIAADALRKQGAWDWEKFLTAGGGGALGGLIGMKIGAPLTDALTSRTPLLRDLVRLGSDATGAAIRGIVPAIVRFPGRAVNTGLNNLITSPLTNLIMNAAVNRQFTPPAGMELVGAFLGGAGRANTISPFNPAVLRAVADPVGAIAGLVAAHRAGVPFNPATISESFPFVPPPAAQPSGGRRRATPAGGRGPAGARRGRLRRPAPTGSPSTPDTRSPADPSRPAVPATAAAGAPEARPAVRPPANRPAGARRTPGHWPHPPRPHPTAGRRPHPPRPDPTPGRRPHPPRPDPTTGRRAHPRPHRTPDHRSHPPRAAPTPSRRSHPPSTPDARSPGPPIPATPDIRPAAPPAPAVADSRPGGSSDTGPPDTAAPAAGPLAGTADARPSTPDAKPPARSDGRASSTSTPAAADPAAPARAGADTRPSADAARPSTPDSRAGGTATPGADADADAVATGGLSAADAGPAAGPAAGQPSTPDGRAADGRAADAAGAGRAGTPDDAPAQVAPLSLIALPGQTSSRSRPGLVDHEIDAQVETAAAASGFTVAAKLADGRYRLRRPATAGEPEQSFVLTARAGSVPAPQLVLARTEVDAAAGTVAVTVSEQALRRSVGRALAHQIAAAATRLAVAADPAGPRRPAADRAGRTAELRYVEQRRAAAGLRLAAVDDVLDLPVLRHAAEATAPAPAPPDGTPPDGTPPPDETPPDEDSDRPRITASWVPGSAAHGEASAVARPVEVASELDGIVTDDPVELARAAGLEYRIRNRRLVWFTEAGREFTVEWTVVPADDLGPPTVVAGVSRLPTADADADRARRTVTIRVSDRARLPFLGRDPSQPDPRWARDVFRAVTHELTEAAALFDDAPSARHVLTPDRAASGRPFSPWELTGHDRARLAEVGVLLRAARDPALRERAGHELAVLLDSLIGVPVAVDPETGAVAVTGRPVQDSVLADLLTATDVEARVRVVNRMLRQIPEDLLGVAVARHLGQLAAARAGATATPIGARWLVLETGGQRVAIHLRSAVTPPGRVDPPRPLLRDAQLPEGWTFDKVLQLTVPAAGPDDLRVVRNVNRAIAGAVAAMRGRPPGPGILTQEALTAEPATEDLSAADVGTAAELVPAVRYWVGGRWLERLAGIRDLRRRLSEALLGFDQPGGELRYRALRAAGLIATDVHDALETVRGARLRGWRGRMRNVAVARIRSLAQGDLSGLVVEPLGDGLITVIGPTGRLTVELVPGKPASGALLEARVSGSVVTVTARRAADQEGAAGPLTAALAGALLPLLDAPAPVPPGRSAGAALLAEAATTLAADAQWRPGGLRMAGPDGIDRDVTADQLRAIEAELDRDLAAGVDPWLLEPVAAELLGRALDAAAPVRITDSWVPGSTTHGEAAPDSRHDEVEAEVGGILGDPAELARATGLDVRREGGRLVWTTELGQDFEIEDWSVVPAYTLGPATVVGGVVRRPTAVADVDVAGGKVRIRVSDQARLPFLGGDVARPDPLWVRDVFRALTHELTEAAALLDGTPRNRADQLTPDAAAEGRQLDPARLSGQDRARLAEVGVLLEAALDPALRARAHQELALLLDHLLGITLTVDPATGELATGPLDLAPLQLSASGGLDARVGALNLMISTAAGGLSGPARAWRLIADAAGRRGALATRVGGTRVVLWMPGRQVAIHLRPADPVPGAGEPLPAPELAPDGVRLLTLPPAGTPEPELARIVERAIAAAVAELDMPVGPGLLAAEVPAAVPGTAPVSTADVAVVADLVAAARSYAGGTGPTADELRQLVRAARLGVDQPGGELNFLAVAAAGLVPPDVLAVLDGLADPRLGRWREQVRETVLRTAETVGDGQPLGQGLARATVASTGRQVVVQVVPASRPDGVRIEVAGDVVTVTASRDLGKAQLAEALAGALASTLDGLPATTPTGPMGPMGPQLPTTGLAILHEAAMLLSADALWQPDGRLRLTGPDGVGRDLPADRVRALVDVLSRNLADGVDPERVRAAAALLLGGELAEVAARSRVEDGLDALGRLADARPQSAAAAAEKAAAALRRHPVPADAVPALSGPARRLLQPAPGGPTGPGGPTDDPYAALRPGGHAPAARAVLHAAQAVAAAVHGTGELDEAATALASAVRGLVQGLERTRAGLQALSDAHRAGARRAAADAAAARAAAVEAAGMDDRQSFERERRRRAEGEVAEDTAAQRERIAAAYARAATLAAEAGQRFGAVADTLAVLTAEDPASPALTGLATHLLLDARNAVRMHHRHEAALLRALPPERALVAGTPTGRLPQVARLVGVLNDELDRRGSPHRFTADELDRQLRGRWPRVASANGVVLHVGSGPDAAELRVRLALSGPVELPAGPVQHSESSSGHFPQGGRTVSVAVNRSRGGGLAGSLADVMRLYTEGLSDAVLWMATVKQAARHLVLELGGRLGYRTSRVATAAALALRGEVDDNRGESTFFDVAARWEVDLAPTPAGWTPVEPAEEAESSAERSSVRLKVPHSYTEHAAAGWTSRFPPGQVPPRAPIPEHWATDVRGLRRLADRVVAELGPGIAPVGSPVRQQVDVLLTQHLAGRLETAVNEEHGLPPALLTDHGQLVAVLRVRTRVIRRPARDVLMVGVSSAKQHLERLRIGFSQAVSAVTRAVEYGGNVVTGVQATPEGGARVTGKADRARALPRQTRVGGTSIKAGVQRWAGRIRAYVVEFEHTVTLQVMGEQEPRSPITERGEALVRIAEPDAYEYGLPVDEAAVSVDDQGVVRLRDDPDPAPPPGRLPRLPGWLGPTGMRGAGPASVRNLQGAEDTRAELVTRLQELGWLPELDPTGFPVLSTDRLEAKSQLENLIEVLERLSAAGLETGYDQASQDGVFLDLVLERTGRPPLLWTLRARLIRSGPAPYRGQLPAEVPVNLHIAAEGWSRVQTQSTQRAKALQAGTTEVYDPIGFGPDSQQVSGELGGGPVRTATSSVDDNVSQVSLVESAAPVAIFEVPHQLVVDEYREGAWHPLATGTGSAEVLLPVDLMDPDPDHAEPETRREVGSDFGGFLIPRLVRARWLHADLGDVLDPLLAALPQTGKAALFHFARFVDALSVVAHPELAGTPYETAVEVIGTPVLPVTASVALQVTPRELIWVGASALVTGHINMTQAGFGLTHDLRRARSGAFTFGTGDASGSATGSGSLSIGTSVRQATSYGVEMLSVNTGLQYVYRLRVDPVLTAIEGGRGKPKTLPAGAVLVAFAERDVLEWYGTEGFPVPPAQIADAIERLLTRSLVLDPAVAIPLVRQYLIARAAYRADPTLPPVPDIAIGRLTSWLEGYFPEVTKRVALMAPATGAGFAVERAEEDDFLGIEGETVFQVDGEEGLRGALDHFAAMLELPLLVDLAEHLAVAGLSDVERAELTDRYGRAVPDLAQPVLDLLARMLPAALDDRPELRRGVRALLGGGERWWGRLRDMTEPGGFRLLDEVIDRDRVVVRLEAGFDTDRVELLGRDADTGLINQIYVLQTNAAGDSIGWGAGGRAGVPVLGPELAVGTDRSHSSSRTAATTVTTLSRQAKFGGVERVRHLLAILVTVERTIGVRRPGRLVSDVAAEGTRVRTSTIMLTGQVIRQVPAGLALRRVPVQEVGHWRLVRAQPLRPVRYADVRQGDLPDRFVTEDTEDTETGVLAEVILALLAEPGPARPGRRPAVPPAAGPAALPAGQAQQPAVRAERGRSPARARRRARAPGPGGRGLGHREGEREPAGPARQRGHRARRHRADRGRHADLRRPEPAGPGRPVRHLQRRGAGRSRRGGRRRGRGAAEFRRAGHAQPRSRRRGAARADRQREGLGRHQQGAAGLRHRRAQVADRTGRPRAAGRARAAQRRDRRGVRDRVRLRAGLRGRAAGGRLGPPPRGLAARRHRRARGAAPGRALPRLRTGRAQVGDAVRGPGLAAALLRRLPGDGDQGPRPLPGRGPARRRRPGHGDGDRALPVAGAHPGPAARPPAGRDGPRGRHRRRRRAAAVPRGPGRPARQPGGRRRVRERARARGLPAAGALRPGAGPPPLLPRDPPPARDVLRQDPGGAAPARSGARARGAGPRRPAAVHARVDREPPRRRQLLGQLRPGRRGRRRGRRRDGLLGAGVGVARAGPPPEGPVGGHPGRGRRRAGRTPPARRRGRPDRRRSARTGRCAGSPPKAPPSGSPASTSSRPGASADPPPSTARPAGPPWPAPSGTPGPDTPCGCGSPPRPGSAPTTTASWRCAAASPTTSPKPPPPSTAPPTSTCSPAHPPPAAGPPSTSTSSPPTTAAASPRSASCSTPAPNPPTPAPPATTPTPNSTSCSTTSSDPPPTTAPEPSALPCTPTTPPPSTTPSPSSTAPHQPPAPPPPRPPIPYRPPTPHRRPAPTSRRTPRPTPRRRSGRDRRIGSDEVAARARLAAVLDALPDASPRERRKLRAAADRLTGRAGARAVRSRRPGAPGPARSAAGRPGRAARAGQGGGRPLAPGGRDHGGGRRRRAGTGRGGRRRRGPGARRRPDRAAAAWRRRAAGGAVRRGRPARAPDGAGPDRPGHRRDPAQRPLPGHRTTAGGRRHDHRHGAGGAYGRASRAGDADRGSGRRVAHRLRPAGGGGAAGGGPPGAHVHRVGAAEGDRGAVRAGRRPPSRQPPGRRGLRPAAAADRRPGRTGRRPGGAGRRDAGGPGRAAVVVRSAARGVGPGVPAADGVAVQPPRLDPPGAGRRAARPVRPAPAGRSTAAGGGTTERGTAAERAAGEHRAADHHDPAADHDHAAGSDDHAAGRHRGAQHVAGHPARGEHRAGADSGAGRRAHRGAEAQAEAQAEGEPKKPKTKRGSRRSIRPIRTPGSARAAAGSAPAGVRRTPAA